MVAAWRRDAPSVVVVTMLGARQQDAVAASLLWVVRVGVPQLSVAMRASSFVMRMLLWVVMVVALASLVAMVLVVLVASDAPQDALLVAQASQARPLHIHHKTSRRGEWDGGSWDKACQESVNSLSYQ